MSDKDWLVSHWECLKKVDVIVIYMVELHEASEVQKMLKILGSYNNNNMDRVFQSNLNLAPNFPQSPQ